MEFERINYYFQKFKYGEEISHTLMRKRVKEILLVSSFYDAFIFEEEGRLTEQIFGEYHQLNLTSVPRITSVPTAKDALNKVKENEYDLVITMMRVGEISPFELGKEVKEIKPDLPVLILLNVQSDLQLIDKSSQKLKFIDDVFLWNGDPKIFLAIIKFIEDKMNIEHDTGVGLVRVILLVEDSIYYYSRLLPELYNQVMLQTQRLISEELNPRQKNNRMRARPKILMAHTFEDTLDVFEKYKDYFICVLSDISFPRNGKPDDTAGVELVDYLRSNDYDQSIILQSTDKKWEKKAQELGVSFIHKSSLHMINEFVEHLKYDLGFGDFIFKNKKGEEITRVTSMSEFENKLTEVPDESLIYHGKRDHFSTWLMAHGEVQVTKKLRKLKVEDFENIEQLRNFLINTFQEVHYEKNKGKVVKFCPKNLLTRHEVISLAEGSLGGKGRGIAFLNALMSSMDFEDRFEKLKVKIPHTCIVGTEEFDEFVKENEIVGKVNNNYMDDAKIKKMFLKFSLSNDLKVKLSQYLDYVKAPIAVRSSGLLEDSLSQPFAGIYQTYMLPNNQKSKIDRQKYLEQAIKLVFASTFSGNARNYTRNINYRCEEEKMAVIIQKVVGTNIDGYYYPHISGVAQSYNFYPLASLKQEQGIASLALGLGHWIVNSRQSFKYCPQKPKKDFFPPDVFMDNSQKQFYAINMNNNNFDLIQGEQATFSTLDLEDAQQQGTLKNIASVWDMQDQKIRYNNSYQGIKVLNFARIVKFNKYPVSEIVRELLEIGEKAFGVPVEIEFAVNLSHEPQKDIFPTFYLLQIRPLSVHKRELTMNPDELNKDELFLYTRNGMGNGIESGISDIVFIENDKFDKTRTEDIKNEVNQINRRMQEDKRNYILIGPGRWGTRDRFLGVPVNWGDINQAKIIVETSFDGFSVDSSQGSHFFHNLIAANSGYLTVKHDSSSDFINWDWLKSQPVIEKSDYCTHVRRKKPYQIKLFGKQGIAAVYK